jgi:GT2 family glycosyltransferase
MDRTVTIVALGKYPDIFDAFRKDLDRWIPKDIRKILVRDGDDIKSAPGWEIIQGPDVFTMAANHNVGWHAVEPDSDILNLNDDIYFLEPNPVEKYQALVYSEPKIGAVAAYVKIGHFGNPIQCKPPKDVPLSFVKTSSNGCTYFRRDMINEVGYYDESFTEKYGAEDADYTYRINLAGWKVGIARDIPIKHGFQRNVSTSTARRAQGIDAIVKSNKEAIERFKQKHGHFDVHGYWPWPELSKPI